MTDGYYCYQSALAERVNGILKGESLLCAARRPGPGPLLVDQAVHLYNEERPHLALNYLPPTKSIDKEKAPPENPSGALALFLSINSRAR